MQDHFRRPALNVPMASRSPPRLWPLYAVNFFMADMQSGIGPFVGVFLQERGWATRLIGTALTIGNVAGMLATPPIGGFGLASMGLWLAFGAAVKKY